MRGGRGEVLGGEKVELRAAAGMDAAAEESHARVEQVAAVAGGFHPLIRSWD